MTVTTLQRVWRPVTSLVFLGLIVEIFGVMPWFGITLPDTDHLVAVFAVLGLHVIGRSAEKVAGLRAKPPVDPA